MFQIPQGAEISLHEIAGLFYILVGGLTISLVVAIIEFFKFGRREAARANIPLREAFRAKTSVEANVEHKPIPSRSQSRDNDRMGWNGGAFSGVSKSNIISRIY